MLSLYEKKAVIFFFMKILPSTIGDNIFSVNDDLFFYLNFFPFQVIYFLDLVLKVQLLLFLNILLVCFSPGGLINRKKRAERTLVYSAELIDSHCCSDQFHFTHHYVSINMVPLRPQINARLFFFVFFRVLSSHLSIHLHCWSSTETVNVLTSM